MTELQSETAHVACVSITTAKPGFEDRVLQELKKLVALVREQDGFIQYDLHRDMTEPRRFYAIENWETKENFEAHAAAPGVEAFRNTIADWVEDSSYFPLKLIS